MQIAPDPNDRTPNDPAVLIDWWDIRSWCKSETGSSPSSPTSEVKDLFSAHAKEEGWDEIQWFSGQCLLVNTSFANSDPS